MSIRLIFAWRGTLFYRQVANGLRYLRWGGDGEAVQLENAKA